MARDDVAAAPPVAASALLPPQQYARASARSRCAVCAHKFSPLRLKHHCRQCGEVVCVMCYTARPVNLPVVGLRRVKICTACTAGDASSSLSSSASSSSASVSSAASSAQNTSARSLAARKLHQIVSAMAPIVVTDASPPLPSPELQDRGETLSDSGDSIDRASLSAVWEIHDLDVPWVDAKLLDDVRVIGSGGNGVVWLVRHRQTRATFAAKRLIGIHCGDHARAKFVDEVRLVAGLSHARVVAFVGAAWTRQLDLQALFEFMPNGDLRRYLTTTTATAPESRGGILAAPWKLQVAIDVADALAYVHAKTPPLVHRDVKSRNVLLDNALRAKLTDFGVSRFESSGGSMTTGVGTGRWLAPEVLNGGGRYGAACDVYSFGVLLSELDTHEAPYNAFVRADDTSLPEMRLMLLIAAGKLQPSVSDDCPATLRALATACWSFDPAERPSAANVAARLRALQSRSFR